MGIYRYFNSRINFLLRLIHNCFLGLNAVIIILLLKRIHTTTATKYNILNLFRFNKSIVHGWCCWKKNNTKNKKMLKTIPL